MRTLLLSAALALAATPALAGPETALPVEHYRLANGLEVILAPDPSVTSAMVEVWYHVGSKDEVIGKSGFAHLFEHLMFEGSKHVPEGQFDVLLESAGGWNNGTTNNDRTTYFEQVPGNQLPLALWPSTLWSTSSSVQSGDPPRRVHMSRKSLIDHCPPSSSGSSNTPSL